MCVCLSVNIYEMNTIFLPLQVVDLDGVGDRHVLARGGAGGSHMTTGFQGHTGTRGVFTLQLKLIAEVGMVG